jgi:hypothetical protein
MTVQKTTLTISNVGLPQAPDFTSEIKTFWATRSITSIRTTVCISFLSLAALAGVTIPMMVTETVKNLLW